MGFVDIKRLLPNNNYDAIIGSVSSPSAANPYATINDITGSTVVPLDPVLSTIPIGSAVMTIGNRYIASATGGGWTMNNIYEWDGAVWVETIPVLDNIVEDIAAGINKRYNGSSWVNYGSISLLQGGNNIASVYMGSKLAGGVTYIRANGTTARARFTSTQMNITGSLYLGSLTASATAKLHVLSAGNDATTNAYQIGSGASANIFRVIDNGAVMINSDWSNINATFGIRGITGITNTLYIYSAGYARQHQRSYYTAPDSATIFESDAGGLGVYNLNGTPSIGFGTHFSGEGYLLNSRQPIKATGSIGLFYWTDTQNYIEFNSVKNTGYTEPYFQMRGGAGGGINSGDVRLHTTLDSYVCVPLSGTVGNFGVGISSPTAKLHTKGISTSHANIAFLVEDASGIDIFTVHDSRKAYINGGAGYTETFGIRQAPVSGAGDYKIFTIVNAAGSGVRFDVQDDGAGVGGNTYVGLGGAACFPLANANYASFQLNSYSASNTFQLFSNRGGAAVGTIAMGHIAFLGDTNRGFILDQELAGNMRLYMTNTAGGYSFFFQGDSAEQIVAGISTQLLGVGITPTVKFHVKGTGNDNTTYWLRGQNSDNEILYNHSNGGIIEHYTNTAAGAAVVDGYLQYSADVTAGNAAPHFKTEAGNVIKLFTSAAYTPSNVTTDRSYNANVTNILELADVVGTLIADLQATGIIG